MKRFAVALIAVAAVAVCVGAPATRQAAADPPARSGDGLAGKFLEVFVRQSTGVYTAWLQNATVRRVGSREFLAGEVILLPDDGAEWQGVAVMLPLDQIDSIYVLDDRDKVIKLMKDHRAKAAAQAAIAETPPAAVVASPPVILPTVVAPPPVILPDGIK